MACPVKTDCGRYVQLIAEKQDRNAYLTARSPNPLASVCARICAAPCEDFCRRGSVDAPLAIRALKRFVTEQFGVESKEPETYRRLLDGEPVAGNRWPWHLPSSAARSPSGKRVAVIGAGPAGLSCAHDLAVMGHEVALFEATQRAGGMAFHGIPEFRLPSTLLDSEIHAIQEMGVEIRYEMPLTGDFGLRQLREEGFEAFFISVGAQKGRTLDCPGSDLDGVIRAVDYLLNINNGFRVPRAKKVLVVGGGFVAFDAARMALRAGAAESVGGDADRPDAGGRDAAGSPSGREGPPDKDETAGTPGETEAGDIKTALDAARLAARAGAEVTLASLESFQEMPVTRSAQGREEFEEALREGIRYLPQRSVTRFQGGNRVERVQLIGVKRTYDEDGRFDPILDDSIHQEVEADLVIQAIGQQVDVDFLNPEDGVELTVTGAIKVDSDTLATTAPGVFAGGDAAFGPRNLIEAVANGKQAAAGIDAFLNSRSGAAQPSFRLRFEKIPTRQFRRSREYEQIGRKPPPTTDLNRRSGVSEVETGYGQEEARRQAERCLYCHIQTVYDPVKCVLCNRCVDICPVDCLKLVPLEAIELPPDQIEEARQIGQAPHDQPASAMLKDDEICIRCGLCAIRCPTDAMTMEVLYYEPQ
ncbi:MAG TPA: FAD-dependent oxidoreductase [Acidobacteriota bacterium]|nr:FAD-dependent oxidoreductase [Acidobacteriota bacterium]